MDPVNLPAKSEVDFV